jgi:hypothetical protein
MDFVVPRTQLFKVSGRVAPPTNVQAPPPAGNVAPGPPIVNITLGFLRLEGGSGFIAMSQTYDPATGNFELRNIVPGSYAIQANAGNSTARLPIEVVNADLTNLVLSLSAGVTIQGRVQVAGGAPMPTTPVRIQLKPVFKGLPHFVGFVPAAQANPADGLFRFDRTLPGEYRATVQAAGHYVKEVRFENSDALNSSFDLSEGRPLDPTLDIVLSPNVAQLDGIVMDDRGQPLPGAQAVLVPNQNRDRFELFKAGTTDQAGRFSMRDVAPGDYKLFAWDSLDNFAYFEPEFISKYETQGKAVHVDESARVSVETKVIPEAR